MSRRRRGARKAVRWPVIVPMAGRTAPVAPAAQSALPGPDKERRVVAQLWDRSVSVKTLWAGDPDPTQAELDAIAAALTGWNDGVRPVVRVVESLSFVRLAPPGGGCRTNQPHEE